MSQFLWGVATSSYQIEGGSAPSERGRCNWDDFADRPGAVYEGHDALVACDHYGRLDADLDLLAGLGVNCYRFSISWPRLLPGGRGPSAAAPGERFYNRLIDGLLARGIEPMATLFHWDFPSELEREGGWLNPESPRWFEQYAKVAAQCFGDRVRRWITINEPHAYIEGGLAHGRHAPGRMLPLPEVAQAAHHTLLGHGLAVAVLRTHVPQSWITTAPVLICSTPETNSEADIEAARKASFDMPGPGLRVSSFWMDPIYLGRYPEVAFRALGSAMPRVTQGDLKIIGQPLDALGFNLYDASVVRAGPNGAPETVAWGPGRPRTAFGWPVTPEAHDWGVRFAYERYRLPVVITENGLSCRDWVDRQGRVNDAERIDFLERHVEALKRAQASGVPVAGYFHWSLMDNFEWNHGYRERFGLVHVDFETLKRTPKASYYAYRDLIRRSRTD
jgi:beta-glucosidase